MPARSFAAQNDKCDIGTRADSVILKARLPDARCRPQYRRSILRTPSFTGKSSRPCAGSGTRNLRAASLPLTEKLVFSWQPPQELGTWTLASVGSDGAGYRELATLAAAHAPLGVVIERREGYRHHRSSIIAHHRGSCSLATGVAEWQENG